MSSRSLASFSALSPSSSPSPRSASSISAVNCPLSISAFEDRLAQRVHRAICSSPDVAPVGLLHLAAGEARLQQKIRQLVEQRLEVDGVGHLGAELAVRVKAQRSRRL